MNLDNSAFYPFLDCEHLNRFVLFRKWHHANPGGSYGDDSFAYILTGNDCFWKHIDQIIRNDQESVCLNPLFFEDVNSCKHWKSKWHYRVFGENLGGMFQRGLHYYNDFYHDVPSAGLLLTLDYSDKEIMINAEMIYAQGGISDADLEKIVLRATHHLGEKVVFSSNKYELPFCKSVS